MGIPAEPATALCACTTAILDITLTPEQAEANFTLLYRILAELITHKRAHPGDDVTTALMTAHDADGDRLSEQELGDTLMLIITAGHETTAHLLDQTISALLTHRRQRAAVLTGRVSWSEVIEETLHLQPPIVHMPFRFAVEDIDIPSAGVHIATGDVIIASLAGAGRDPGVHDNADRFDPTRPIKDHLAFGHGTHYCLGAPLARPEAGIALPALFTRFPSVELATGDPRRLEPIPSIVVNGHRRLPVRLGG